MIYRLRLILTIMVLYFPITSAQEAETTESPSIDFLEFLGEWETAEGEWIDPVMFEEDYFEKVKNTGSDDE